MGRVTALCLEVHDLIVSKLDAGRLKDLEFIAALLQMRLANVKTVRRRIRLLPEVNDRSRLRLRLQSVFDELRHSSL